MAEDHVTILLNSADLEELANVVSGDEDSHDLPGSINGQSITVRFRAEEDEGDEEDEPTYTIKRFWLTGGPTVLQEGVTLEEAQEHCNDPETSSSTATSPEAVERTETFGPWFDGYEQE